MENAERIDRIKREEELNGEEYIFAEREFIVEKRRDESRGELPVYESNDK